MYNEEYNRLRKMVNDNLHSFLPEEIKESRTVLEAMKYSLDAGGKRLRPVLLLEACRMAGGSYEDALPFACAIEYIHTYSLIHDDLPAMDDDDLRRGKPTNHKVFGEACAVLAGDALLNRAYEVMLKAAVSAEGEMKARMAEAALYLGEAAGYNGIIGGQIADIEGEETPSDNKEVNLKTLEFIHMNKTAALIRGAILAGAIIGGCGGELRKDLEKFGELLGLAFQICDDILDIVGNEAELGKPIGSDDKNGKLTYPACVGLEESRKIYEKIHGEAVKTLEKYGEQADFLIETAQDLYSRTL